MLFAVASPTAMTAASPVQTTVPAEVMLAFDNPAPGDPSDPCRTGLTSKTNDPGDHDGITVCTFDSSGTPAPTEVSSYRLGWSITPATSGDPTAVVFNPEPPEETTGAEARAAAGIDALRGGHNFITVTLLDESGTVVDSFSLEKHVREGSCNDVDGGGASMCRDVPTVLIARNGRVWIRGEARSEPECQPERSVTLFLRRKGPDNVIGIDTTDGDGRWRVSTGRPDGTYYARTGASSAGDDQTGGTLTCLPDQSNPVRAGDSAR